MDIRTINDDIVKMSISKNSTVEDALKFFKEICQKHDVPNNSHTYFHVRDLFFKEYIHNVNRLIE